MGAAHRSSIEEGWRDIFPPLFHTDERAEEMSRSRSAGQVFSQTEDNPFHQGKTCICLSLN